MRDFIVLAIILGSAPLCFFSPYFGILMWSWVAYFNPHRYTWGIAYNFPVAAVVAVPTLAGLLFERKLNFPFRLREMILLMFLWCWFIIVFLNARGVPAFAGHIQDAQFQLMTVSKILLMTVVTILVVTSRQKLHYLLLLTAGSLGIRAVAGAIFGLRTGGAYRFYGPPDSFLADNNDMGLALNMLLPMMFFLAREVQARWLRIALRVTFVCSIFGVFLTYSRGALLGLAAVLALLGLQSRHKVLASVFLVMGLVLILTFAPPRWMSRMGDFVQGNLDQSAEQRLVTWGFAWNLAKAYPMAGASFAAFPDDVLFQRYTAAQLPGGFLSSGPHSIYFQTLGEQGFIGLGLYLLLLASCCLSLQQIRRGAQRDPSSSWMVSYSCLLQTGLVGYMVSGAFLGRAYFDLFYMLVASTIVLKILYRREMLALATASVSRPMQDEVEEVVAT